MANGIEEEEELTRAQRLMRARLERQGNAGASRQGPSNVRFTPALGTGAGVADSILGRPAVGRGAFDHLSFLPGVPEGPGTDEDFGEMFGPWLTGLLGSSAAAMPQIRKLASNPRLLARLVGGAAQFIPHKGAKFAAYGLDGLPIAADLLASLTTPSESEAASRQARAVGEGATEAVFGVPWMRSIRGRKGLPDVEDILPGVSGAFQEAGTAAGGQTRRRFIQENMPDGVQRPARPTPDTTTTADAPNASRTDLEKAGQGAFNFDPAKRSFQESQFGEGAKYSSGAGGEAVVKPSTAVTRPGKNPQELVMTRADGTPVFEVADQITDSKSLNSHVGFLRHLAESGTFPETVEQMVEMLQLQTANSAIIKRIIKLMPRELMGPFGPVEWDRIAKGVGKARGRVTVIESKADVF